MALIPHHKSTEARDGDLVALTAAWRVIDASATIEASDTLGLSVEDASGYTENDVIALEQAAFLAEPVDGVVTRLRF